MEKISWTDRVRNGLLRAEEEGTSPYDKTIERLGHILLTNCLLSKLLKEI
jgi:hypothetical protein